MLKTFQEKNLEEKTELQENFFTVTSSDDGNLRWQHVYEFGLVFVFLFCDLWKEFLRYRTNNSHVAGFLRLAFGNYSLFNELFSRIDCAIVKGIQSSEETEWPGLADSEKWL